VPTPRLFPSPRRASAALALLTLLAAASGAERVPLARVTDLDGRRLDALPVGPGPTVLVFTATECPISNRYAPELRRLRERFAGRGVTFRLVYADPAERVDAIRRHLRAFGYGEDALRDPAHELVRLTGATVTPEAAVFVAEASGPRLAYRGRIDDRAVDFGRTRPAPRVRDLEQVLEALVSGQAVPTRTTTATGCFIPELQ
jgi:AhpC/TSA family protein